MQKHRRRFKQTDALEVRLANEAMRLKEAAQTTPPGIERERLLRKARQADTGAHVSEWLRSPGLRPPTKTYPTNHQSLQQLQAKLAEQVEIVAQLICEGKVQCGPKLSCGTWSDSSPKKNSGSTKAASVAHLF